LPEKSKKNVKHIIAVGSGKGGVGKSSLSALLAVSLARKGNSVGVLDADITGPSIPKLMGIKGQAMGNENGIIPFCSKVLGIKVMSINLLLDDPTKPVVWRGPLIGNVIKQFWEDVDWGDLDYLVVDLPPGTADAPLTVMQVLDLDGFVMVTSPQELSVLVVEKAANMTQMLNVPLLGVIENMSFATCPHCGEKFNIFGPSHVAEIEEKFDVPVLGELPLDPKIAELGDAGRLEEYENPEIFEPLIQTVIQRVSTASKKV
jgi:Mrp family chromosome partitioning ATPase